MIWLTPPALSVAWKVLKPMMPALLVIALFAMVFGSGFFLGRRIAEQAAELVASHERSQALETQTRLYHDLLLQAETHRAAQADLERRLVGERRRVDKAIADVLQSNPDVARWYHADINDIERAVLYGLPAGRVPSTGRAPAPATAH